MTAALRPSRWQRFSIEVDRMTDFPAGVWLAVLVFLGLLFGSAWLGAIT